MKMAEKSFCKTKKKDINKLQILYERISREFFIKDIDSFDIVKVEKKFMKK